MLSDRDGQSGMGADPLAGCSALLAAMGLLRVADWVAVVRRCSLASCAGRFVFSRRRAGLPSSEPDPASSRRRTRTTTLDEDEGRTTTTTRLSQCLRKPRRPRRRNQALRRCLRAAAGGRLTGGAPARPPPPPPGRQSRCRTARPPYARTPELAQPSRPTLDGKPPRGLPRTRHLELPPAGTPVTARRSVAPVGRHARGVHDHHAVASELDEGASKMAGAGVDDCLQPALAGSRSQRGRRTRASSHSAGACPTELPGHRPGEPGAAGPAHRCPPHRMAADV